MAQMWNYKYPSSLIYQLSPESMREICPFLINIAASWALSPKPQGSAWSARLSQMENSLLVHWSGLKTMWDLLYLFPPVNSTGIFKLWKTHPETNWEKEENGGKKCVFQHLELYFCNSAQAFHKYKGVARETENKNESEHAPSTKSCEPWRKGGNKKGPENNDLPSVKPPPDSFETTQVYATCFCGLSLKAPQPWLVD